MKWIVAATGILWCAQASAQPAPTSPPAPVGYLDAAAASNAQDESDLTRAIEAYRFFYPTVSGAAIFKGNEAIGIVENKVFGTLDTKPRHVGFTLNSDTPYAPILLDLKDGPMVVELPAGPLIAIAMDVNQRWLADIGLPGPDAGKGGKHVFLPPGYKGKIPAGSYVARSSAYRVIAGVRALPVGGDVAAAIARLKAIKVYPLGHAGQNAIKWLDLTPLPQNTTPLAWEDNLQYWQVLAEVIDREPPQESYRDFYGELAALEMIRGKAFSPDPHMTRILGNAARIGNLEMRAESLSDTRPDRVVWPDRLWEWAALRYEDGNFDHDAYADLVARDKRFYQAIGASPAMFRRSAGAGSLYWLGLRSKGGAFLDGGKTYRLTVPQPVPGKLFWSVTVYDAATRSQVQTPQEKAALRSLFELKDQASATSVDLYFGPTAPAGKEGQWIQTLPGKGWFVYFRVYGPEKPAFDGSWKPGDFEELSAAGKGPGPASR